MFTVHVFMIVLNGNKIYVFFCMNRIFYCVFKGLEQIMKEDIARFATIRNLD